MTRSVLIGLIFLAATQPGLAAPANPGANPKVSPSEQSIDPQRLALGREIASAFFPNGTMQKMMSQMGGMQSDLMSGMFDATPKDLGVKDSKAPNKTLRDAIREKDPYFEERMAITNRVMMEEMGKIMGDFEPQMREAFARIYAKRYSIAELTDIANFFRSSSGKAFGEGLMPMMMDPEYTKTMASMMPKVMQAMPSIAEKLKKATAHLPPPPPKDTDDNAQPAASPTT